MNLNMHARFINLFKQPDLPTDEKGNERGNPSRLIDAETRCHEFIAIQTYTRTQKIHQVGYSALTNNLRAGTPGICFHAYFLERDPTEYSSC